MNEEQLKNIELIPKEKLAKWFIDGLQKQGFDIDKMLYLEVRYYHKGDMRIQRMLVIYKA